MKTNSKTLISVYLISLMFTGISCQSQHGNYDVNSQTVLASSGGYNYTEGHFNKALRFLEFLLGTQITETEKQQGLKESIDEFHKHPQQSLQEVNEVDMQMQQLYQLTNPVQIALARSSMLSQLFQAAQYMEEKPLMIRLMDKYTPMLANDPQNMLVFTESDFQGYLKINKLYAKALGQKLQYSEQEIQQMRTYLSGQFNNMSLEQKQNLCVMAVIAEYSEASYNRMSNSEKAAWQNQIIERQAYQYQVQNNVNDPFQQGYNYQQQKANYEVEWPQGVNTKAEKQAYLRQMRSRMNANAANFSIMNDMMLNNHATMLNTIENFGNTGNYWEVKYNDY